MSTTAKVVIASALAVLVGAFALAAFMVGRGVAEVDDLTDAIFGRGEVTNLGPVNVHSIRSLADLTTYEMVEYTLIEKADDRGWLNWATGDRVAMFVVARIGAGIDLGTVEAADIQADPATGVATIRIPPAAVVFVDVDEEQTTVFDRDTGIFTSGDPNLEQSARLAAESLLVDAAVERDLLTLAEEEAQLVIRTFVESLGYTDVAVLIDA